jgi:hypothetical protein
MIEQNDQIRKTVNLALSDLGADLERVATAQVYEASRISATPPRPIETSSTARLAYWLLSGIQRLLTRSYW